MSNRCGLEREPQRGRTEQAVLNHDAGGKTTFGVQRVSKERKQENNAFRVSVMWGGDTAGMLVAFCNIVRERWSVGVDVFPRLTNPRDVSERRK